MSDLSLEQEVTGLMDKPERSPLDQKNEGVGCMWLFIYLCIPVKRLCL